VDQVLRTNPHGRQQTQANRAFLRRVVRYLAERGVRQFLDLGAGVPTVGPVHEIAHRPAPGARVVYMDNEPIAATYSSRVLAGVSGTAGGGAGHPQRRRRDRPGRPAVGLR
jgi:hypothetical protein